MLKELTHCSAEIQRPVLRHYFRTDLFFLLYAGLGRKDAFDPWLFERCKEVEAEPDEMLDVWAREHYKSTIITFAKTIQDILASHGKDPLPKWKGKEITIGIFSHTRPNAKGFLSQIKTEFEGNTLLQDCFDDVLYKNPQREAPKWSEDGGIVVKRESNPKESTVEAWGVVDGQPTGKHFDILVYDDLVTEKTVTSEDMRKKTVDQLALSYNLGAHGGRKRFIGTRYHLHDAYKTIIERGTVKVRKHAATDEGTIDGVPVFLDDATLKQKRRDMGPYVFGCQMLQDPQSEDSQNFDLSWLKFWKHKPVKLVNKYIVCDPAKGKSKKRGDYVTFWVIGLGSDNNYYVLDMVRDRLNLTERTKVLFELHEEHEPKGVGYEEYGMQADIEHIEYVQERDNYHFKITPLGGSMAKNDRIRKLVPVFEDGRMFLPEKLIRTNKRGETEDLVQVFIKEEYEPFPVGIHPDMFDSLARIIDPELKAKFPKKKKRPAPKDVPAVNYFNA